MTEIKEMKVEIIAWKGRGKQISFISIQSLKESITWRHWWQTILLI